MRAQSQRSNWASVNRLIMAVLILGSGQLAGAADGAAGSTPSAAATQLVVGPTYDQFAACNEKDRDIRQLANERTQACSDAGMNPGNCSSKILGCMSIKEEAQSGMEFTDMVSMFTAQFGKPISTQTTDNGAKAVGCTNQESSDYYSDKKDLQDRIKDLDSQMADLDKDIAEAKKDLNDKMEETQKELNEAQKALADRKRDLKAQKRDTHTELLNKQNDTANSIRELEGKIMTRRQDITKIESDYTKTMINLSDSAGNLTCIAQVKKLRDELAKQGLFKAGSGTGGFVATGNAQRKALQDQFDSCLANFKQQRIEQDTKRRNALELAQKDLDNMEESMAEMNNALKSYNTQIQEALQDLDDAATDEEKALIQQMQTAQTALQNANTNTQEKISAIKTRQQNLQAQKGQFIQELNSLGPAPVRGATKTWRDAMSATMNYTSAVSDFITSCCESSESAIRSKFGSYSYCKQKAANKKLEDKLNAEQK